MELSSLTALSPLDGRYADKCENLRPIFSEYGLMRRRLQVELAWLTALADEETIPEVPATDRHSRAAMDRIVSDFDENAANRVKAIEAQTNHDVKAVEYWLRERFQDDTRLSSLSPFLHFACTSEDINNLAYALMLRDARDRVLLPVVEELTGTLRGMAKELADAAMLSRTHGQTASPTTMGKELANFAARLGTARERLAQVPVLGKINGAVGNFNAHVAAYPDTDWLALSRRVVESLELEWNAYTTQIEPHDFIAELLHAQMRINTILVDLCRDIWGYISLGYFGQRTRESEVGSSTMPHKVNPIDFENAEGNLGIANSLCGHLADKLPVSRWQRDLTDSTVLRTLGTTFGHAVVALAAILRGLDKLELDRERLREDLDQAWEVLAEPIQTVMRRYGAADAYERLKTLTRGKRVGPGEIKAFVMELDLPREVRERLAALTPEEYTGLAERLAREV